MSVKVTYRNGVFEPVEDVTSVPPGQNYTAFSDEELADIGSTIRQFPPASAGSR